MWLAGGGVKPGITLGETDEFGFNVADDQVHVHDLHATILHLLGFDHTQLTYRFQGRDFRLTDVHGQGGEGDPGVTRARAADWAAGCAATVGHRVGYGRCRQAN